MSKFRWRPWKIMNSRLISKLHTSKFVGGITVSVLIMVVLIITGYWFNLSWIGFNGGYSKVSTQSTIHGVVITEEHQPSKNLWDWLQLLFVPAVLAFGGLWFTQVQHKNEQNFADQRAENDRKIARDGQQEAALQKYMDKISELIFEKNLPTSKTDDKVRVVARARTLTILRTLDDSRKGSLIQFLYESGLLVKDNTNAGIVRMSGADLGQAYLNSAYLREIDLSKTFLSNATLTFADLSGANLSEAILYGSELSGADLSGANLGEAILVGSDLLFANLSGANLCKAYLGSILVGQRVPGWATIQQARSNLADAGMMPTKGADLTGANLSEAKLEETDLGGVNLHLANLSGAKLSRAILQDAILRDADLSGADLSNADLLRADLSGAKLSQCNLRDAAYTDEQLLQAKMLTGAIMRDGSIHP